MKIPQLGALAFALVLNLSLCFAAEGQLDTVAGLNERAAGPDTASTPILCPLLPCPLNVAAVRDPTTGFCGCPCFTTRICPNGAPSYYDPVSRFCKCRCLGIVCPLNSGPALIDSKTGICRCSPLPILS